MDCTNGYEPLAAEFIARRSKTIGRSTIQDWLSGFSAPSKILDIGCGNGVPVSKTILEAGHSVFAIDASPSMIQSFTDNFPDVPAKCESVEESNFFEQEFDGVVSIGLIFLLQENQQLDMIHRVGSILRPGGSFLFTAPIEVGSWKDRLTGQESRSLGEDVYIGALERNDFELINTSLDEGKNNHYTTVKR